ncbi:MAG: glutamyl-Q tRNA(Asp) synthetase [Oceanicoccus sp.]|jgi:glutamyl-Q tRNA(Asp) synthetase
MTEYIGRFAPSPTGHLHIGSLIGALASYLDAKSNQGRWLLRMEDLDPPREIAGAADSILRCLDQHGLQWHGQVLYQSQRLDAYQQPIDTLLEQQKVFYCQCSRSELQANNGIYNGRCRGNLQIPTGDYAIRLQVDNQPVGFSDAIQGHYSQSLQSELGDIVLKRKDGFFAYQLAAVVDDDYQQINHIVRGSDLMSSTPRQIYLQQHLKLSTPSYSHIPVISNAQGQKLSKQNFAVPLQASQACRNLLTALAFLQQPPPPPELQHQVDDILRWAVTHWQLNAVPKRLAITEINHASKQN